jgi:hypothetical protein
MPTFKVIHTFTGENKGEFPSFLQADLAVEKMCAESWDDADHEIHCDDGRKWVFGADGEFAEVTKETTVGPKAVDAA